MQVQKEDFRNCANSSNDPNKARGWLQHYRDILDHAQDQTYCCSAGRCNRSGTHGAHVIFKKREGVFLVPLCPTHNNPKRTGYYHCVAEEAVLLYHELDLPSD